MAARKAAIIPLLLACTAPCGRAQEITLPRRLAPGRYVFLATTTHSQVLTRNGVDQPWLVTTRTLELALDVRPAEPGANALVELSFRRIAQTLTTRSQTLRYDSAAPKPQPGRLQHLLAPLLKARLRVALNAAGRVARVEGLDAVWDARALKDPPMAKWLNQIKAEMGDEMLGDLLDQVGRPLPDKPVRVGDSWKGALRFRLPYVGEKKDTHKVVLKGIERKTGRAVAVLDLGDTYNEPAPSIVQVEPIPLTVQRVQVTQTGELRVGLTALWPVDLKVLRVSTLTMSGNDPTRGAVALVLKHRCATALSLRPEMQGAAKTE